jgi:hypothetical protein
LRPIANHFASSLPRTIEVGLIESAALANEEVGEPFYSPNEEPPVFPPDEESELGRRSRDSRRDLDSGKAKRGETGARGVKARVLHGSRGTVL